MRRSTFSPSREALARTRAATRKRIKMGWIGEPLRLLFATALTASVAVAAGCGGSNSSPAGCAQVLDPTQPHDGQTDAEWGALWWKWFFELPETANTCVLPFQDPTGANCGYDQTADVFFLAGTTAGTVVRDQCVVPSGKAILVPILSFSEDNAGVPAAMQVTPSVLVDIVQEELDSVPVSALSCLRLRRPALIRFTLPGTCRTPARRSCGTSLTTSPSSRL
jgi:hypothetical protein